MSIVVEKATNRSAGMCPPLPRHYRGQETAPSCEAETGTLRLNPRAEVLISRQRRGVARELKGA